MTVVRRGYFGITKDVFNVGSLWRSADLLGAAFIFTIGRRYRTQASDTMKSARRVPLHHYADLDDFYGHLPYDVQLIGLELDPRARAVEHYCHPDRAVYLLGAEDHGLSKAALAKCHQLVQLPGRSSLNVAVAGSLVMYDRWAKQVNK